MGTIELTLTRFIKFWFLRFKSKTKVGFCFWNEAILFTARRLNIELDSFFDWAKKNQTLYFSEMLYSAYEVWCKENYQKPLFNKSELLISFSLLPEKKQKKIMKVWQESESFGVKESKKKVAKK